MLVKHNVQIKDEVKLIKVMLFQVLQLLKRLQAVRTGRLTPDVQ